MSKVENLFKLLEERGISDRQFAKDADITRITISNWRKGITVPHIKEVKKAADYLNVSVDFLLGETNESKINKSSDPVAEAIAHRVTTSPAYKVFYDARMSESESDFDKLKKMIGRIMPRYTDE
jgi:transcriptional regulator with XRE-family HTH domain